MHIWGVHWYGVPTYILRHLESESRINIVWRVCRKDSLKSATRAMRGSGKQREVLTSTHIPSNWQSFVHVDENKTELFYLHAQQAITLPIEEGKELYSMWRMCPYISKQI